MLLRPVRRLNGKQRLGADQARSSKGAPKADEQGPAMAAPEGSDGAVPIPMPKPQHDAVLVALIRAIPLEHMLVQMFGRPGYFAILAVAFRRA